MHKILIVDDEITERNGVKYLIDEYGLPLDVIEAVDGEAAWEYLKSNPVDILLTDIKMPFMDGLQLSARTRELYPEMKIVIFSAYDQFEFAKEAIKLNVFYYILKPVVIDEFLDVMRNVINACEDENKRKVNEARLLEKYNEAINYEREKVLLDIINGIEVNEELIGRMRSSGIEFEGKAVKPVMFDIGSKFFDKENDFKGLLRNISGSDYEYVNLNEKQCLIFIHKPLEEACMDHKNEIWNGFKDILHKEYGIDVCIIVGQWVRSIGEIYNEYLKMEQTLDYKFFFDGSIILHTGYGSSEITPSIDDIDEALKKIYECIDNRDFFSAEKWIGILCETMRQKVNLSSLFVKYTFIEIVRKVLEKSNIRVSSKIKEKVETIFKSDSLYDLKDQISSIFKEVGAENAYISDEFNSIVIKTVLSTIHDNYMNDISLESIAEKVYLSPAYLSSIFKKATGQSLIKYLTAYRLERARELLKDTCMKIEDIGRNVGYLNFSYFCWVFRAYFGVSPSKYRGGSH